MPLGPTFLRRAFALPAFVISLASLLAPSEPRAEGRCAEAPVEVSGAAPAELDMLCAAARDALRLLGACRIDASRAIRVETEPRVTHPFGRDVIAYYDSRRDVVRVTHVADAAALVADTPYRVLAPEDFYRSMVVHEIVHAVMAQRAKRMPTSASAQEYPAYALQIASLPEGARARLLETLHSEQDARSAHFNDIVLAFDPFYFATRAYAHFTAPGSGCARLHALLSGDADFIATLP